MIYAVTIFQMILKSVKWLYLPFEDCKKIKASKSNMWYVFIVLQDRCTKSIAKRITGWFISFAYNVQLGVIYISHAHVTYSYQVLKSFKIHKQNMTWKAS